jgi:cell division protein FtsB
MTRSRNRLSHKKEIYYILCIVAVFIILLVSFFGPGGYRELQKARLELQEQHIRVDQLERQNNERMESIEKLRSDRNALEKYAREKGYGREGEIIQQLPKEQKQPEPPKPAIDR